MALTRFKLVNTQGLNGLHFNGDTIPFDKIDDNLAEQLIGKTHVLERVATEPQLALASAEPAHEPEPAATGRRRSAA